MAGGSNVSRGSTSGLRRREIGAWAFYDFANSAFTTLVVTFIFGEFFTRAIADEPIRGAILWTRAVNISSLIVALTTPVLGAIADNSGRKKLFLFAATTQCVIFTALLFFVGPGDAFRALVLFVIANVGYETAQVFYNGFLPELSTPRDSGRISGLGQGLGYVGGLVALGIAFALVAWLPDEGFLNVRSTNLLVAAWYALFSLPILFLLHERAERHHAPLGKHIHEGFRRVRSTMRHLRAFREAAKLLLARLIYNDGLVTIFAFAAIYASATFGMVTEEIITLGLALNVAAGLGALAFGPVNDRIGGKKTIMITLIVLIAASIFGAAARTRAEFWTAGILIGLMIGPNQAASRSLLANFVPEARQGEFFGFYAFSGRLSAVAGPFVYGLILALTEDHRLAMISIIGFFLVGLIVLAFVDETEGVETARRLSASDAHGPPTTSSS